MSLMNACSKPVIQIHNLFSPSLILAFYIFENSLNSSSISTILARKRQKTFSKAFGEKWACENRQGNFKTEWSLE